MLLAADFDLSQYPAVEGFLLTAENQGDIYRLSLRDRSQPDAALHQLMLLAFLTTPQSVSIEGSAGDDSLWIDFSTVITVDAGGNFSDFIPASINFTGLGGIDEVEFTGPTAVTGNIIVDAETIVVGAGNHVAAGEELRLAAAADLGTLDVSGVDVAQSGSVVASVTISGHLSATEVVVWATTGGSVISTGSTFLGNAENRFIDEATIFVSPGATIAGSQSVELFAQRSATYSATGVTALNRIVGDTSIVIGAEGVESQITAGDKLSIRAIDNIRADATSPEVSLDLSDWFVPFAMDMSSAKNTFIGDTQVVITDTVLAQSLGGGAGTLIQANRKTIGVTEVASASIAKSSPISDLSISFGGS